MSFKCASIERRIGVFFLTPQGRLDSATAPQFEKQVDFILQGKPTEIVFDMEQVDYLSSAGVRVFFKAQKALSKREGEVILINVQPAVQKVFEIINALPSLSIFESIDELDAYLDKMQRAVKEED